MCRPKPIFSTISDGPSLSDRYRLFHFFKFVIYFSFVRRLSQGRSICKITKESTHQQHRDVTSATNRSQGRSIILTIHYGTMELLHISVLYATRNTHEKNILLTICARTPWFVVFILVCHLLIVPLRPSQNVHNHCRAY